MGVSRRIPQPEAGVYGTRRNVGRYFHRIVTSTGGDIDTDASDQAADSALTVTKTATETGRYTIVTPTPHRKLLAVYATVIGADDAAYGAATVGLPCFVRNDDMATTGTVLLQFAAGDTNWSDAEIADAASVMLEVVVEG